MPLVDPLSPGIIISTCIYVFLCPLVFPPSPSLSFINQRNGTRKKWKIKIMEIKCSYCIAVHDISRHQLGSCSRRGNGIVGRKAGQNVGGVGKLNHDNRHLSWKMWNGETSRNKTQPMTPFEIEIYHVHYSKNVWQQALQCFASKLNW